MILWRNLPKINEIIVRISALYILFLSLSLISPKLYYCYAQSKKLFKFWDPILAPFLILPSAPTIITGCPTKKSKKQKRKSNSSITGCTKQFTNQHLLIHIQTGAWFQGENMQEGHRVYILIFQTHSWNQSG